MTDHDTARRHSEDAGGEAHADTPELTAEEAAPWSVVADILSDAYEVWNGGKKVGMFGTKADADQYAAFRAGADTPVREALGCFREHIESRAWDGFEMCAEDCDDDGKPKCSHLTMECGDCRGCYGDVGDAEPESECVGGGTYKCGAAATLEHAATQAAESEALRTAATALAEVVEEECGIKEMLGERIPESHTDALESFRAITPSSEEVGRE